MADHPTLETLEDFVAGRLRDAAFERHVSECETCAARLCTEARVELVSRAVVASRARVIPFSARTGYVMGFALAIAASMLLFFHAVTALAKTREIAPSAVGIALADGGALDGRVAMSDGGRGQKNHVAPCEDCGPRD